jgi:hypothetical protein
VKVRLLSVGLAILMLALLCAQKNTNAQSDHYDTQAGNIKFFNYDNAGNEIDQGIETGGTVVNPLLGPTSSFDVCSVMFVGWEATFDDLEPNRYRMVSEYVGPDGITLGSMFDVQTVSSGTKTVTFRSKGVGNHNGGAFLLGIYTVKFYLNGKYLGEKSFEVTRGPQFEMDGDACKPQFNAVEHAAGSAARKAARDRLEE